MRRLCGQTDLTRVLDRRDRSFGRDTGWDLNQLDSNGNIVGTDHTVTYGYDIAGRLETVTKAAAGGNPALVATRAYDRPATTTARDSSSPNATSLPPQATTAPTSATIPNPLMSAKPTTIAANS